MSINTVSFVQFGRGPNEVVVLTNNMLWDIFGYLKDESEDNAMCRALKQYDPFQKKDL